MPSVGFPRALSLQIALYCSLVAYRGIVWVLVKLTASATLAQKIPAAIQLHLNRLQALMLAGLAGSLIEPEKLVLLPHQTLDLVQDALIVHNDSFVLVKVSSIDPKHPTYLAET
jgi:hypothetical protein